MLPFPIFFSSATCMCCIYYTKTNTKLYEYCTEVYVAPAVLYPIQKLPCNNLIKKKVHSFPSIILALLIARVSYIHVCMCVCVRCPTLGIRYFTIGISWESKTRVSYERAMTCINAVAINWDLCVRYMLYVHIRVNVRLCVRTLCSIACVLYSCIRTREIYLCVAVCVSVVYVCFRISNRIYRTEVLGAQLHIVVTFSLIQCRLMKVYDCTTCPERDMLQLCIVVGVAVVLL